MATQVLKLAFVLSLVLVGCQGEDGDVDICQQSPGELFEKRIAPLLEADHPSTCAQCHGGGIALADFLRPDVCESMACLSDAGLVDLDHPDRSVLLTWIDRAEPDSALITKDVIQEERKAFSSWIEHESECRNCSEAQCTGREPSECEVGGDLGGAFDQETDPLDCEDETIERLFRGTVYAWRSRCSPCHFREEEKAAKDAPRWLSRTGDCRVASLASLQNIVGLNYVHDDDASQSLLLLKPLAEFEGGMKHGGHDKFVKTDDRGYDAFLYFLERYIACKKGK